MSHMRTTMQTQPAELRRILDDRAPAQAAAERIAGRRTWLVGIGTSWHAAHHGAWLLREAGVDAAALHAADVAPYDHRFGADEAVVVLSHTGQTGYTAQARQAARDAGAATVHVTAIGNGGDVETVAPETSYAYTASHTGALMRLAQMAQALGAQLGDLAAVPGAVARVLDTPGPLLEGPPARLLELIGAGPNAWTAQEGALKIREAAYVVTEGLSSEQFLHGPSVALDERDTLVVLDGGGPAAARSEGIAGALEVIGAGVERIKERDLGEQLSIFPLTVWVQRIAVELAEARGVSPDRFRYEEDPRREQAIESLGF
jgi:glucosamine--fructose-6-phosphate aminotransferase (isomerizing)